MRWSHECHTDNTNAIDAWPQLQMVSCGEKRLYLVVSDKNAAMSRKASSSECPTTSAPDGAQAHICCEEARLVQLVETIHDKLARRRARAVNVGAAAVCFHSFSRKRAKEAAANGGLPLGITRVKTAQSDV